MNDSRVLCGCGRTIKASSCVPTRQEGEAKPLLARYLQMVKQPVFSLSEMFFWKQDASLTRRWSNGNPACPYELRLIHFTLLMNPSTMPLLQVKLHPLATASASSSSPSTKVISSAIPLARMAAFHCSRRICPSRLRELPAKVLRELEHDGDGLVALNELVQIGRLLCGAALLWPHHHERNASGRRRLVQDDRLFGDGAGSFGTKGAQPHLKCTPRTRVSPPRQFPRTTWLRYGTLGSIAKKGAER